MVADVTVVGSGVIGLAIAAALGDRGLQVRLIGTAHRGEASPAAAGMLAPSVEAEVRETLEGNGATHRFAVAARDAYPAYLAALEDRTRLRVPLNRLGVIELAATEDELAELLARAPARAERLNAAAVAELEPELSVVSGGLLHPDDGCVDTLLLLDALRMLVATHTNVTVHTENVCELHLGADDPYVLTDDTNRYPSHTIVLAAGAWTPEIVNLPRPLAIEPVRGQMLAFAAKAVQHTVFGTRGYLVPKTDGNTLAGSTMERVGYDADTTTDGLAAVQGIAEWMAPSLARAEVGASWAGLRPVTPDMLPLLGADPTEPRLVYACGHSRNGILLAPLTAAAIADIVTGTPSVHDLTPFRPDRQF